jgi:hypothetical protein
MINSISSSQTSVSVSSSQNISTQSNSTLSSYQKEYIGSLLENYDSSNLSSDDALEIVSALKDQGIAASEELASTMADSGFDAKEIGDLAGVSGGAVGGGKPAGGPPPPPPQAGNQTSEEEEDYISELLDSLLSVDEDDTTTATNVVNGVSFDEIMDYTSRIVNLNEQSQEQVMTLLNDLSSEDNELTDEQKSTIVKHNLGQLLANPDNYNRVSFYA